MVKMIRENDFLVCLRWFYFVLQQNKKTILPIIFIILLVFFLNQTKTKCLNKKELVDE